MMIKTISYLGFFPALPSNMRCLRMKACNIEIFPPPAAPKPAGPAGKTWQHPSGRWGRRRTAVRPRGTGGRSWSTHSSGWCSARPSKLSSTSVIIIFAIQTTHGTNCNLEYFKTIFMTNSLISQYLIWKFPYIYQRFWFYVSVPNDSIF